MNWFKTSLLCCFLTANFHGHAAENQYSISTRGPHHRIWQKSFEELLPSGLTRHRTNQFVELRTGLHRQDPQTGEWIESKTSIDVINGSGVATQAQMKVVFAGNLNPEGAIDVLSPGQVAHPLALGHHEGADEPRTGCPGPGDGSETD